MARRLMDKNAGGRTFDNGEPENRREPGKYRPRGVVAAGRVTSICAGAGPRRLFVRQVPRFSNALKCKCLPAPQPHDNEPKLGLAVFLSFFHRELSGNEKELHNHGRH